MVVPSSSPGRALLAGLLLISGCAKSGVPIDGPTGPVSGTVVPGAAAPGTVNLETAPAMRVNVTLLPSATASDVMTLTVREELGNSRVTAVRNAVAGGGTIAFDPIDVTALQDGMLLVGLDLSNAAGTTHFDFAPVLKDTVLPAVPVAAALLEDPGSGTGSVPPNTINLRNHQAARVQVEFSAGSLVEDRVQLTFSDGTRSVVSSFAGSAGTATVLSPVANLSALDDGPVTIRGLVRDRANNPAEFDANTALKDTLLALPTMSLVAEGASNPQGFVNEASVDAAAVRALFPAASLATDWAAVRVTDGTAFVTSARLHPLGGVNSLVFPGLDLATLVDGPLALSVIVEDDAGNYLERVGTPALKDTVLGIPTAARVVGGASNAENVINALSAPAVVVQVDLDDLVLATDRLSLSATDGVTTLEFERAASAGPAALAFAPFDAGVLSDGPVDVVVELSDLAANRREVVLSGVPKDTLVPTVPVSVEVPMGPNNPGGFVNAINQSTATIRVVTGPGADADRTVQLRVVGGGGVQLIRNRAAPAANATILFVGLDLTGFPEGMLGLEALTRDASGNTSAAIQNVALLDRSIVGPSAAVIPAGPDNDLNVISAATEAAVTFQLSFPAGSAAGDLLEATLSDGATTLDLLAQAVPGGGADLVVAFVDTSSLADGPVVMAGAVRDAAGNSVALGPFSFDKDTVSPGAPLSVHVGAGTDNELDTINLASVSAVAVEVEFPASYDGTERVFVRLADTVGTQVATSPTDAPAGGGPVTFGPLDATSLLDGPVALAIEVTDASQNMASYAGSSATKDTTLPAAPLSAGIAAGSENPADTINLMSQTDVRVVVDLPASYTGDELVSVLLQDGVNTPPVSPRLNAPAGGGPLSFVGLDTSSLLDGPIEVTVRLSDAAGNDLDLAGSAATKDVLPPQVDGASVPPTVASALDSVSSFDVDDVLVRVVWGANLSGPESAIVRFDDGSAAVESASFSIAQTTVAGLDLSPLADGELELSVVARDPAGNETVFVANPVRKRARRTAPRFAFVANLDDDTLSVLQVDDGGRGVRLSSYGLTGPAPRALAVDYAANLIHVANSGAGDVASFRVDPVDGTLQPLGSTPTGAEPSALALHPSDRYLLVASRASNRIESLRVDALAGTLQQVSTAPAGAAPDRLAMDPAGRFVFAGDSGTNEIWTYAIDASSGALSTGAPLALLNPPTGLAVHPSGSFLYVGTSSSITPFAIDALDGSLTPLASVAAPSGDVLLAVRPDGRYLYAASAGNSRLTTFRIDAGTPTPVAGALGLSGRPSGIALCPTGDDLYVASSQSSELQTFSLDGLSGTPSLRQRQRTRLGAGAVVVAGDERGVLRAAQRLYAVHQAGASIAAYSVDPGTGSLAISGNGAAVGPEPRGLTIDAEQGLAFVANEGGGTVTRLRLDPQTGEPAVLGPRAVGSGPNALTLDVSRRFLYVSNGLANTLSMLSVDRTTGALATIAAPIATGPSPGWVAADSTGQFVFVVHRADGTIGGYRVDATSGALTPTSVPTVPSGGVGAARAVVHPSGRTLYVSNEGSNSVTVFRIDPLTGNLTSLGQPTPAGTGPGPLIVDPAGQYVLVGNTGSGDISVYEVSSVTGALVPVLGAGASVGSTLGSLAVDPTGRFVHASEPSADLIVAFALNRSTGTLSLVEVQGAAAGQPSGLGATGSIQ